MTKTYGLLLRAASCRGLVRGRLLTRTASVSGTQASCLASDRMSLRSLKGSGRDGTPGGNRLQTPGNHLLRY